jgi:AcrR family transcriptional regulator
MKNAPNAYHHGNLREAIVATTLELVEKEGVKAVSVREIAKRLEVSPGAPFRHFASKKALLSAVATEAMESFAAAVQKEIDASPEATPADGLRAIGRGYLRWALENRAQFAIISNRDEIEFSDEMSALSESVMSQMNPFIIGLFPGISENNLAARRLACRALVYGLARMAIDRHYEEWSISTAKQLQTVERVLDQFIEIISK